MPIGIMQGRMVPPSDGRFQCFPRQRWADEFEFCAQAGISAIEWIYDLHGADVNPIASDAGISAMQQLSARYKVAVRSVCADYFMDLPLVRVDGVELSQRIEVLRWLMQRCQALPIQRIVLPFVDASAIEDEADIDRVVAVLDTLGDTMQNSGIELHLETALGPVQFAALLERVRHPMVKVNYDSGNSASLGYAPREEFAAYGLRVGSVHIKDRVRGGGTVALGSGDADFDGLFASMVAVQYSGDIVLQVARGEPGDEVAWTRANCTFVNQRWPRT